jgi:predicted membrane protein
MAAEITPDLPPHTPMHLPSLLTALLIMLVGTVYPLVFARHDGSADHGLAFALFWAMSAGLVRGVGFVPNAVWWKLLFSGWSCIVALLLAAWMGWGT